MPTRRTYDLRITNTFTDETAECNAPDLLGCRDAINKHFGCNMITKHGVVNLMVRGKEGSPDRFAGIRITSREIHCGHFDCKKQKEEEEDDSSDDEEQAWCFRCHKNFSMEHSGGDWGENEEWVCDHCLPVCLQCHATLFSTRQECCGEGRSDDCKKE